jgi:hypothetical protein
VALESSEDYRCTKKAKHVKCSQAFVREEDLDRELSQLLLQFALTEGEANEFLERIDEERMNLNTTAHLLLAEKRAAIVAIQESLKRLLDVYLAQSIDRPTYDEKQLWLHSEKRTLTEQMTRIESQKGHWLEPFRSFVKAAQNVGKTAQTGSLFEKKDLAIEIFGSNLVLDAKKARGSAINPWIFMRKNDLCGGVVPRHGLEP